MEKNQLAKLKTIHIEGMNNILDKTYDLNDINYFCGPNGAGKSTILDAIQLALLGYIPGHNKTKETIFKRCNGRSMAVTLTWEIDGKEQSICRTWVKDAKGTVTSSVSTIPSDLDLKEMLSDIELPVFNFSEFLGMTANTMKQWFIDFLPNIAESKVDWDKEITNSPCDKLLSKELIDEFLDSRADADDDVSEVTAFNAFAKDELSYQKGQLKIAEGTLLSLIHYDDAVPMSDEEVQELKAKAEEIKSKIASVSSINTTVAQNSQILSEMNRLGITVREALEMSDYKDSEEYKEYKETIQEWKSQQAERKRAQEEITNKIIELNAGIVSINSILETKGMCPFLEQECDQIKMHEEDYRESMDELNKQVKELRKSLEQRNKECSNFAYKLANAEAQIRSRQTDISTAKELASRYKFDAPDSLLDVKELQAELQDIQDTINKYEANKVYTNMSDDLLKSKKETEDKIECISFWIKHTGANGVQTDLAKAKFEALQTELDPYLKEVFHKDVKSHFNLEQRANSFSFGIMKDGKYIAYEMLSSGEKCLFLLALLAAILNHSASSFKLLLIDDLMDHLDPSNLNQFVLALSTLKDIQFVLAGVNTSSDELKKYIIEVQK